MKNIHNFNAGPSVLPKEVINKSVKSIINFNNSGISILEISHRSLDFINIVNNTTDLVKSILNLNDDYSVLFLQGGATLQFSMIPYNFLLKKALYLDTGFWAYNAIKEAKKFGKIDIVFSSRKKNYSYIVENYNLSTNKYDYFHCTSNNTIVGSQMKVFPKTTIPIICDMSSDIFSRKLNFRKFSLIYASAQKNLSSSGMTIVIIKNEILKRIKRKNSIPYYLDYRIHMMKNNKILNTPNILSIYISMLNLKWIKKNGGISSIEKKNRYKAKLLYEEIDRNIFFENKINKKNRSNMNVSFFLKNDKLKKNFDEMWKKRNILGLEGHRLLGGYRASLYNAVNLRSVKILIEVMKEFEEKFS